MGYSHPITLYVSSSSSDEERVEFSTNLKKSIDLKHNGKLSGRIIEHKNRLSM